MEKLQLLKVEYKKFLEWGYNRIEAIEKAKGVVFPYAHIYIHKDSFEDFSHIFYEGYVLFEDGSMYKEV